MTSNTTPTNTSAVQADQTQTPNTTIQATVLYRLSDAGQKAALIAGKSAARDQQIAGPIALDLLSLCKVNDDGSVTADYRLDISIDREGKLSRGSNWTHYNVALDAPAESAEAVLIHMRDGLAAKGAALKTAWDAERALEAERNAKTQAERAAKLAAARAIMEADPLAIPELPYEITPQQYPEVVERARRIEAKRITKSCTAPPSTAPITIHSVPGR